MRHEIIIGGRGGQGVQLMGYLLGYSLVKYEGLYVVQTEEYGASTRGGESYTELVVGDNEEEVEGIKVRSANIGVFMFQQAWEALSKRISEKAVIIYDGALVSPNKGTLIDVRAGDLARDVLNAPIVSNMIMLGALSAATGIVSLDNLKAAVTENVKRRFIDLNIKALELGYNEALKPRASVNAQNKTS